MIKYSDFLIEAEEKGFVVLSKFTSFRNYLVKSFEIWKCGDDLYCIQVFMNDDTIIFKETDKL